MLPTRSSGVLTAPLDVLTVLYDLLTETVHVLNPTAGLVWDGCDGTWTHEAMAADLLELRVGSSDDEVRVELDECIAAFQAAGLVDRAEPWVPPIAPAAEGGAAPGRFRTKVLAVLDDGVVMRSDDRALVAAIEEQLGSQADLRLATVTLGVEARDDGTIELTGLGPPQQFASLHHFLEPLPTVLNRIAACSTGCLALHAGCVRSPAGEVIVIPAVSGSGKTTLTAALVQEGWTYGSDEATGIHAGSLDVATYPKPLVLDAGSRELLGLPPSLSANVAPRELRAEVPVVAGTLGPVDRIVLPRYEPGAGGRLDPPLEPQEAAMAVLEHALNLRFVGEPGLIAIAELALRVPVQRLVHGDAVKAARSLSAGSG